LEENQYMLVAAAILQNADGRVLIARRRRDISSGGRWEFPGGKVETGETPASTVVRELREELNISISPGDQLCRSLVSTSDGIIDLVCIWATLTGAGPTSSTDHDELAWFDIVDLPSSGWCAPDLEAVALLRSGATSGLASR
jgi:8-oxo-dGTP diphosphatase